MCYDFLMLTDVLKIGLRQHAYRGFYDKMPSFFAVFLAYLKYLLYVCTTNKPKYHCKGRTNFTTSIQKVFKLWCNCCLSGIIRFCHSCTTEDVTVVPWALSHPFHGHGTTVSSSVEQVCQHLLSQLFQRIVCSLTISH